METRVMLIMVNFFVGMLLCGSFSSARWHRKNLKFEAETALLAVKKGTNSDKKTDSRKVNGPNSESITGGGDPDLSDLIQQLLKDESITELLSMTDKNGKRGISDQTKLFNGVVRIYCTHAQPNFGMPWQKLRQEFSTSSGFVISGNRILTNAHAVEYGSLIQVKKRQSEKKYVASVVAVGHEWLHVAFSPDHS